MTAHQAGTADSSCLFCKMANREAAADIVAENDSALAFRDIDPQAPSHILVIPTAHYADVAELAVNDPRACTDVMELIARIGRSEGAETGFRTVFNTGAGAGQLVFHCHAHVLAGRSFTWPPG